MSDEGTAFAGVVGGTPEVRIGAGNPEAAKYGAMWTHEEYRHVAPGEQLAAQFIEVAHPPATAEVLDLGCGTGRGALMLAILVPGLRVTMVDFVNNCLDEDVRNALTTQAHVLRFVKADLEQPLPVAAAYGYCTDVMEHIPPDKVERVLDHILHAAQHVFFAIATVPDSCGELIGETLHLTVQPFAWWREQFERRHCVIHFAREDPGRALFYVSVWESGEDVAKSGKLNTTEEQIRANVQANIAAGWQQVTPHLENDKEVLVLGGGPSMPDFEADIKERMAAGAHVVTLNGAYIWALNHGITRVTQIMVDARQFNARFTKPALASCRYLLASQCHPDAFEGLDKAQTWLFHTSAEQIMDLLTAQYGEHGYYQIIGGSTVLLRAIPLLRMLGFKRFHLYGCDSCLIDDAHHAYPQPENDRAPVVPVSVTGGRIFHCMGWMVSQAQEFMDLIRSPLGDELELEVHGDGLLAHILHQGAELEVGVNAEENGHAGTGVENLREG